MTDPATTDVSEAAIVPAPMAAARPGAPEKPGEAPTVPPVASPAGASKPPAVAPVFLTPQPPHNVMSPDGNVMVLVSGSDTGGAFSLVEVTSPPFTGEVPSVHAREDTTFYVVAGNGEFAVGETKRICTAGSCIFVPRGVEYGYRSVGTAPLRVLAWYSPGGFEEIYRDIDKAGVPFGSAEMRKMLPNYGVTSSRP